jgi:hypothetical protein
VCPTLFLICRAHVVNGKANVKIARRDDADVKRCSNACGKITGVARAGRCEEVDACGKITGVARAGRCEEVDACGKITGVARAGRGLILFTVEQKNPQQVGCTILRSSVSRIQWVGSVGRSLSYHALSPLASRALAYLL